jgi:hypothetical protein
MKPVLPNSQVKRWLRGQKAAMRRIEKERSLVLRRLTPEQSAKIYQSLNDRPANARPPSPLLWKMRKVLKRYSKLLATRSA